MTRIIADRPNGEDDGYGIRWKKSSELYLWRLREELQWLWVFCLICAGGAFRCDRDSCNSCVFTDVCAEEGGRLYAGYLVP